MIVEYLQFCVMTINFTDVVVEASEPKVYRRVTVASASTLSGAVVRTLRGGEWLLNMFFLVASSLGHLRSQCSIVCGSSLQRGHRGSAERSRRLAYAFSSGVWPAPRRASRTASGRLLVAEGRRCRNVVEVGEFRVLNYSFEHMVWIYSCYVVKSFIVRADSTTHFG